MGSKAWLDSAEMERVRARAGSRHRARKRGVEGPQAGGGGG